RRSLPGPAEEPDAERLANLVRELGTGSDGGDVSADRAEDLPLEVIERGRIALETGRGEEEVLRGPAFQGPVRHRGEVGAQRFGLESHAGPALEAEADEPIQRETLEETTLTAHGAQHRAPNAGRSAQKLPTAWTPTCPFIGAMRTKSCGPGGAPGLER